MTAKQHVPHFGEEFDHAILTAFRYHSLKVETGSRPVGFRFSNHIVNLIAELNGQRFVATGEAETQDLAMAKAKSELLERSVFFENANRFGAETTNGWAAHPNFAWFDWIEPEPEKNPNFLAKDQNFFRSAYRKLLLALVPAAR